MNYYLNDENSINSSTLKIYAMIFMLLDHIGGLVIESYLKVVTDVNVFTTLEQVKEILRGVGRLAFPIFCYQLVVGFKYTHSKFKHILALFIFMIISEVPFDLALTGVAFSTKYQSTYFTLLLGGLAIVVMDFIKDIPYAKVFQVMTGIAFATAAYFLKTDYGFAGVILIVAFYLFINNKFVMIYAVPLLFLSSYFGARLVKGVPLNTAWKNTLSESISALAMLLIIRDNGVRKGGKYLKWIGYSFYPFHILLLYLFKHFVLKI